MHRTRSVGKMPRKHRFVLNPYRDARFTRCPICEEKTKLRKFALFVHVDPMNPIVLGKTSRYCPDCDLLIVHQDELEAELTAIFAERDPDLIGNDYLVMGTVDRKVWRAGMKKLKTITEMLAHVHDFEEVLTLEVRPLGWCPADES